MENTVPYCTVPYHTVLSHTVPYQTVPHMVHGRTVHRNKRMTRERKVKYIQIYSVKKVIKKVNYTQI
jgi:hypothetical protein